MTSFGLRRGFDTGEKLNGLLEANLLNGFGQVESTGTLGVARKAGFS
jgi:hypothetical protein